ncbi:MAG: hypothetical protein RLO51_06905 [Thalassobaculum sp.]|uniref:hypothetical protein n=1 Tax=Thalassobaculum sp. TaxID=2022740 RepID=UPI0032EF04E0
MTQRRQHSGQRVTIGDLAQAYDRSVAGKPIRLAAVRSAPVARKPKVYTASQGDVRLSRLKARAEGIRFALQYENQSASQSKVLRQILQNLELAIRGMEMTRREP